MRHAVVLETVPEIDPDAENADGKGEWHQNAELKRMRRAMTPLELADFRTYDRAAFRARARMKQWALDQRVIARAAHLLGKVA